MLCTYKMYARIYVVMCVKIYVIITKLRRSTMFFVEAFRRLKVHQPMHTCVFHTLFSHCSYQ